MVELQSIRSYATLSSATRLGTARMALRWPRTRQTLLNRVAADSRLSDLCEAYEIACAAADYWTKVDAEIGRSTAEQFCEIATGIEDEILSRLI